MERNETNEGLQNDGVQAGANEFSGTGAADSGAAAGGFDFSGSTGAADQSQGLKDRARSAIGTAGNRLADVGSTVRERAGSARDKLAGALEAGAERLRDRSGAAALAAATPDGSTPVQADGRMAQVSDRLAGGMERSAEWLRDADLDSLTSGIETQVKEHPGRTLLIAVGLGYLIGRAFRGGNQ